MASISAEITSILDNTRGEDVRDAFTGACEKIAAGRLPEATTEGYVLTVNASGKWEAMEWT